MAKIRPAVAERTQGCWNCVHSSKEKAAEFWKARRQADLNVALNLAMHDPLKEAHPQVKGIRRMVDQTDQAVAAGLLVRCKVEGSSADLISLAFLCDKWTGAEGASVARAGQKADKLPGEMMEDFVADPSKPLTKRKIQ